MISSIRSFAAALIAAALMAVPVRAAAQDASLAPELSNCAGAVAAHANLDVFGEQRGSGEWAPVLHALLDAMNREPGVEGMTGRYAASAAKGFWAEQPAAERASAANECRARFVS